MHSVPDILIRMLEFKMKNKLTTQFLLTGAFLLLANSSFATVWMIGDNDGYGANIADGANHTFDIYNANYDGRSVSEINATNGAQYTDTYSTTHTGYGPQTGNVATFVFDNLGGTWTEGSMWFDMADFQATTFGAVNTTYNGIVQNWTFNDGAGSTVVRSFDLAQNVIDSINLLGSLTVVVDRFQSTDFYGFDYALLSNNIGENTNINNSVPEPTSLALLALGLAGFGFSRKKKKA